MKRWLGRMGGPYIRFVHQTSTVVSDSSELEAIAAAHHPCIFAFWHGQFLLIPAFCPPSLPVTIVIARHGDAELVGDALQTFSMDLIRGSGAAGRKKDRGGAAALRAAIRALEAGKSVAMTADVPPGPARQVGRGIIKLAQLSGRPILPIAAASSRFHALDTWSRMTINLPFSKIGLQIGEPVQVAADADEAALEDARQRLEQRLNQATSDAYEIVGGDLYKATPPNALAPNAPAQSTGLSLKLYRAMTRATSRAAPFVLRHRQRRGKEDEKRLGERFGLTTRERPDGLLAWFHAASVGETNAILPLFDAIRSHSPDIQFLLTTGTVTSAKLASERLNATDIHQYAPLDTPQYMRRFLEHWRPQLAVLTESEIWPNLIIDAHDQGIPLAIVNGRMSDRSYRRWRQNKGLAVPLFGRLQLVLAQNAKLTRRFRDLGARDARTAGNLKVDAPLLPIDASMQSALRAAIGKRPVWIAASTHPGEDEIVLDAHRQLAQQFPDVLTIIAPRHPERGAEICDIARQQDLSVAQRSKDELPNDVAVYVADTIGELGTFYSIVPIAFIGGSIALKGGQNPFEAVRFGSNVLTGPDQRNFVDAYAALIKHNGAIEVTTAEELAAAVGDLMANEARQSLIAKGANAALESLSGALERTVHALLPLLPEGRQDLKRAS